MPFPGNYRILEQSADYTQRGGFGPWSQLVNEGLRLQILAVRGNRRDTDEVLRRVIELRDEMRTLSDQSEAEENVPSWNVRETILGIGYTAALMLEQWPQALDLNYRILQSQKARNALAFFIARTHFNAYGPLLRLRRYSEARHLLLECRNVFERENSIEMLGKVLSALADVEDTLGGPATARQFEVDGSSIQIYRARPEIDRD